MFCSHCGHELAADSQFCPNCGNPVHAEQTAGMPAVPQHQLYAVAPRSQRLVNLILDYIFYIAFAFVVGLILGYTGLYTSLHIDTMNRTLLGVIVIFIYYTFFEAIWQQTPAKWITKTKVVRPDGSKPDFAHILGRTASRLIPFEAFSFLVTPRGWHDSISGTLVVSSKLTAEEIKAIDVTKIPKGKKIWVVVVSVIIGFLILTFFASVVLLALNSARSKARDAQRVSDVQQIKSALQQYKSDIGSYPLNLNFLAPKYINQPPAAPQPADGNCSSSDNSYVYDSSDSSTYTLSFCLGNITQGTSAGKHTLTPAGMDKPDTNANNNASNSTNQVEQADYEEGYKAGYADGRSYRGKLGDSFSPPATPERRPAYDKGYVDGFTQGCSDGNYDCTDAENQLNNNRFPGSAIQMH